MVSKSVYVGNLPFLSTHSVLIKCSGYLILNFLTNKRNRRISSGKFEFLYCYDLVFYIATITTPTTATSVTSPTSKSNSTVKFTPNATVQLPSRQTSNINQTITKLITKQQDKVNDTIPVVPENIKETTSPSGGHTKQHITSSPVGIKNNKNNGISLLAIIVFTIIVISIVLVVSIICYLKKNKIRSLLKMKQNPDRLIGNTNQERIGDYTYIDPPIYNTIEMKGGKLNHDYAVLTELNGSSNSYMKLQSNNMRRGHQDQLRKQEAIYRTIEPEYTNLTTKHQSDDQEALYRIVEPESTNQKSGSRPREQETLYRIVEPELPNQQFKYQLSDHQEPLCITISSLPVNYNENIEDIYADPDLLTSIKST